jgi:hypothetical protein
MLTKFGKFCAFAGALLSATPSLAFDWSVSGHVIAIEGTYMPSNLPFQIDVAGGSCAAGTFLHWNIGGSDATTRNINAQSVLSILMTAKSSGQKVTVFGNNSGCTIDFIYLQ